jgi:hypothetical protein
MLSNPYLNIYEIDLLAGIKIRWFLNASRIIKARTDFVFEQLLKLENTMVINGKFE